MTNRCYLSCSDFPDIYPSFSDSSFDCKVSWIDHGAGCLPLLWLPLFSEIDLTPKEFSVEGEIFTEIAPITRRLVAIDRLQSKRNFLNQLFQESGGLDYHIDVFSQHLRMVEGDFLTAETQEISWLYSAGEFSELLTDCLHLLDREDFAVKEALVDLSTVMPERKFLTKHDLDRIDSTAEKEDSWNFFRILGESYLRSVPWE